MSSKNEDRKPTSNMEAPKEEASSCGPGCGCHAGGTSDRIRWIVGAVIIIAAGALVARAMMKNSSAPADITASGFAALTIAGQAPVANAAPTTGDATAIPVTVAVKELGALNELNMVAADTTGVFVYLPGKGEPLIKAPLAQMRSAAKTIEA